MNQLTNEHIGKVFQVDRYYILVGYDGNKGPLKIIFLQDGSIYNLDKDDCRPLELIEGAFIES